MDAVSFEVMDDRNVTLRAFCSCSLALARLATSARLGIVP
jgi:hypothetical protein